MDSSIAFQAVAILILIALSSFFSSAETAMTTVNKIRIQSLAEQGNKRAVILEKIISDSPKMLSTVLIGNNIVNMSVSSLMTTLTIKILGNAYVGITTGILTLLILIFGEITPKNLATIHAEKLSLAYSRIIYGLMILLTPVVFIVNKITEGVLVILHVNPDEKANAMTEHELRTLVNVGEKDGVIENEEKQMIYNVFDFGDSTAKDVMIPRIDMTFIDINFSYDELMAVFSEDMHTRFPVYEDNTDNVIGIINMKDLLVYPKNKPFSIRNILREPYFTYEYKGTADLLMEMKEYAVNLAIVLDEYGATAGMITLEDLLEEMPPFLSGGEMIESVTRTGAVYAELPHKFEADTVNAAGAAGLAAAIRYVQSVGFDTIQQREHDLTVNALARALAVPHVHVLGTDKPEDHNGIITFTVDGVHPHDISEIMASDGVNIRAGHHCAQPLLTHLGLNATARASFAFYNTDEDVDRFIESLSTLRERMGYGK